MLTRLHVVGPLDAAYLEAADRDLRDKTDTEHREARRMRPRCPRGRDATRGLEYACRDPRMGAARAGRSSFLMGTLGSQDFI